MLAGKNKTIFAAALIAATLFPAAAWALDLENLRRVPIQHNGRVKTLDTFARQFIETVSEKETWEREAPVKSVLRAAFRESTAFDLPWVRIRLEALKTELGLPKDRQFFTYKEVLASGERLEELVEASRRQRDRDLRPTRIQQAAESLYTKMMTLRSLAAGESLRFIPAAPGHAWVAPHNATGKESEEFRVLAAMAAQNRWQDADRLASQWVDLVHHQTRGAHKRHLSLEILYTDLHPFQWSWIAYLAAFILLSISGKVRWLRLAGYAAVGIGIAFHTTGLILRVLILERPPVSNMYESMIYMNWALMLFALAFWLVRRKNRSLLSVGSAISAAVMIYGNLLPLDANMEVLVPVLRSNYWLTIHVMTIVSSYGAFGLAMGLGHRHLIFDAFGKFTAKTRSDSAELMHRVIQLGVFLIGVGTVLGGVWANESWGRFWGWDPKETWALITFLGYLIMVHLKYARKISEFWTAAGSILGFFLVLMTWYGVNFVLGRGLHSYGFGSGGVKWIVFFLVFEAVFLAFFIFRKYRASAA